jgi:diguanylate cyclase (GGDEF)-like protein/PAS domain S-box-containing protein
MTNNLMGLVMVKLTTSDSIQVSANRILLGLFALVVTVMTFPVFASTTPVNVQLRWYHQFQFAGYYAALEKGFYADAGLDVHLIEGGVGADPVAEVVSGKADFGISTSGLALDFVRGKPILLLASIFQHSANVLLCTSDIKYPTDLVGKKPVVLMAGDGDVELKSIFINEGIRLDKLQFAPDEHHLQDLIDGRIDALYAYASNEPFSLQEKGIPYTLFKPENYGMDFYGDSLFTNSQLQKTKPAVVESFRLASIKGWYYALEHSEEIVDLIIKKYNSQHKSKAHLLYEAQVLSQLIDADVIHIGHSNEHRWRHIANVYASFGLAPNNASLTGFIYDPEAQDKADLSWLYRVLGLSLVLLLLVAAIAALIIRNNRRLSVTVRKLNETQIKLAESEEQIRVLANSSSAGLYVLQGSFLKRVNQGMSQLTGYSEQELLTMPFELIAHPDDQKLIYDRAQERMAGKDVIKTYEFRVLTKTGDTRWVEISTDIFRYMGKVASIGTLYDITTRKHAEETITQLAHFDALTGLANRTLFEDRVGRALAIAEREMHLLALFFIDLDKFKPVNDNYGHAVGDALLKFVADRIQSCLRTSDSAGRIGGDEFVVLLPHIQHANDASLIAEKVRAALEIPFDIDGCFIEISTSIGIACYPLHGKTQHELSKHADIAMYQAKEQGRNGVVLYH